MKPPALHGRPAGQEPTYVEELLEVLRVAVVAGLAVGIVVIGLGSRLAMLLLRLTSPEDVIGVTSDDGFEIGRATLAGTYNLLTVGAAVGFIGAVAYIAVAPWLIGPGWFRRVTVGLTAGAVGGALVIIPDGIDFTRLEPTWLAATLFVGLPLVVGVLLSVVADAVAAPDSWAARGRWRWLLPVLLLAAVPLSLGVVVPLAVVVAVLVGVRRPLLPRVRASRGGTLVVRSAFLVIPVLAFAALGRDLAALS